MAPNSNNRLNNKSIDFSTKFKLLKKRFQKTDSYNGLVNIVIFNIDRDQTSKLKIDKIPN